jgi:hypothetical protein
MWPVGASPSLGFQRIAVFTRRVAGALGTPSGIRVSRRTSVALRLWRQSLFCHRGKGYISYQWHFAPLSNLVLKKIAARKELLTADDVAVVLRTGEHSGTAFVHVLAGGQRGLIAARQAAGERGYGEVQTFLPRDSRIVRWARRAGYTQAPWGRRAILYERRT